MMSRSTWSKSAVAIALLGLAVVAIATSPVGAVFSSRKAKKLDAAIAPRVAYTASEADAPADPGGKDSPPTINLTTTISAPKPGFLILEGSVDLFIDNPDSNLTSCMLRIDSADIPSSKREITSETGQDYDSQNCDADAVVPVQGGAHTVDLVVQSENTVSVRTREAGTLSATYVPYDGSGKRPTAFGIV